MTNRREQVFHCAFQGSTIHVSGHVRAWDSPEALEAFAAELRGEGVRVPGTMAVTAIGAARGAARAAATARFRPAAARAGRARSG